MGRFDLALGRKLVMKETPVDLEPDPPKKPRYRSGDFHTGQPIMSDAFNEIFERLEYLESRVWADTNSL